MLGVTRAGLAAIAAILALSACYTWNPAAVPPETLIPRERPRAVRATNQGGATVTFEAPRMENDSIVGFTGDAVGRMASRDVSLLEVRRFSPVRTTALVASHVAAITGLIALFIWIQPHYYGF